LGLGAPVIAALSLGLAPMDWMDLAFHAAPWVWLVLALGAWAWRLRPAKGAPP
jgi:hypothetical protein